MKFNCSCGVLIVDSTDDLPHKGHVVPDQEWFATFDALDELIDATAEARMSREHAYQRVRELLSSSARLVWQCPGCGRLYLDDRNRQLQGFVPESESVDHELLRSRPS